ncbi:alkyl hydroperoxide reductase [Halobacteriales archaeon QH_3_68_24]|nr:MAG: alkyl hydroperoxide reductase [Halobacteriales archaeon QH_3_68_24]
MLSEGAEAPAVVLPGYVDGERERVDLGAYLGEGIVVLAFYPADFNPACSMQTSDLDDLDLFTMQRDVSVFAVSPDSTYSHEAFAERYGLRVPLLSDVDGGAAGAYGVDRETETGERLPRRAVFVVDHRGIVQHARATDDLSEPVDVGPVKRAVGDIGGDETALERYRAGVERYAEGRAAFTEAMADYEDREWMPARSGFERAEPAFADAADHLDTAVRFAESEVFETVADRAEEKADTLQHAADWFAQSADALGGGRGKQGAEYREDAERVIDAASGLPEPPESDAFTLTDAGIEADDSVTVDSEGDRREPSDGASGATASREGARAADSAVEADFALAETASDGATHDASETTEGDTVEGDLEMDLDAVDDEGGRYDEGEGTETPTEAAAASGAGGAGGGNEARAPGGESTPGGDADGSQDGNAGEDAMAEDVEELDLADPTEGEEEEGDDDERADWDIPGQ